MNGRASPQCGPGPLSKWTNIHRVLREKKIGVLCLQETHLTQDHIQQLETLFGRRLKIINSHLPDNPGASAGVAFVINKELLLTSDIKYTDLIPGRAMALTINWHNKQSLTLINIYAPNSPTAHARFWTEIEQQVQRHPHAPDILTGDFNIVEDPLDRAPAHADYATAVECLRDFRNIINVHDIWRADNPTEKQYTYVNALHSHSRIDRIYAKPELKNSLYHWDHAHTSIPSDHKMVSVRIIPEKLPYIGHGRWTCPLSMLNNQRMLEKIQTLGIDLMSTIESRDDASTNPQRKWTQFKREIAEIVRSEAKLQIPKMSKHINETKKKINLIKSERNLDEDPDARATLAALETELQHIEQKRYRNDYAKAQAKWHEKGEKIGKYWMSTQVIRKPRDIILALVDPQDDAVITRSSRMAEVAGKYHDDLQRKDLLPQTDPLRKQAQLAVINDIPENQKFGDDSSPLNFLVTEDQISTALRSAKNGTATGLDGLPYELWKTLHDRHIQHTKQNKPSFDLIRCLKLVYNDIQQNGMDPRSHFADGWMSPIYKKKDRSRIENYRPIILLNTDYKLFTKVLATQLASHACQLLHPDQTGFVPTRSIFDPIRLADSMCAYAEYMDENGAIIALDQEKAYDKIDHTYLLNVLRAFRLPEIFISTIASIYKNATTTVVINGEFSEPYLVTRGVRQGDPLSCLLFNLAIEPLAASLRGSPDLTGFPIPGSPSNVLINLYADDTTVYLSETDRYDTLERLLVQWCRASGAKFNIEKTEIVPIGTPEHRRRIVESRKIHPDDHPLNERIKVAKDGEATRVLGAWIGNNLDTTQTWTPVLDKIQQSLKQWNKARPTLDAKRLIIQLTVGAMSQFLTKAQGMPPTVANTLNKMTRNFLWDEKQPAISLQQLQSPRTEGGIDLLNLEARNLAIEVTWLKSYLDLTPGRPTWAFVTDAIINCIKPSGIQSVDDINIFLTSLRPSGRAGRTREGKQTPLKVISLLRTAKTAQVTLAPLKLSKKLKRYLPAWYHVGAPPKIFRQKRAQCLREIHSAKIIKDMTKIAKRLNNHDSPHLCTNTCKCRYCRRDRRMGCQHPHTCATLAKEISGRLDPPFDPYLNPEKDDLSLTHRRTEKNRRAIISKGDDILFNPTVTTRDCIDNCFRIFGGPKRRTNEPAFRVTPTRQRGLQIDPINIYTDGSCTNNGKKNASSGAGIVFENTPALNRAIRVPGSDQSNQTGELAAVLVAITMASPLTPIRCITDSRYVIEGLTTHLMKWEDAGWVGIKNAKWFRAIAYRLRHRAAPTFFKWIKGHVGHPGNEEADRLANIGARKTVPDLLDISIPPEFDVTGIKLKTSSQKLIYKYLVGQHSARFNNRCTTNLELARSAVKNLTGNEESDGTIWTSIRTSEIRRIVQTFTYRAMHNSLRTGSFWSHIPNYQHRAICALCDEIESIEHIIFKCKSKERRTIWPLVRDMWPKGIGRWNAPDMGLLLGCGSISPPPANDPIPPIALRAGIRLAKILISEAAYLIWSIRCERVIGEKDIPINNIQKRWTNRLNLRLSIDRQLAFRARRKPFQELVHATWNPILSRQPDTPRNWANAPEVLVGITLCRPSDPTEDTGQFTEPHTPR